MPSMQFYKLLIWLWSPLCVCFSLLAMISGLCLFMDVYREVCSARGPTTAFWPPHGFHPKAKGEWQSMTVKDHHGKGQRLSVCMQQSGQQQIWRLCGDSLICSSVPGWILALSSSQGSPGECGHERQDPIRGSGQHLALVNSPAGQRTCCTSGR